MSAHFGAFSWPKHTFNQKKETAILDQSERYLGWNLVMRQTLQIQPIKRTHCFHFLMKLYVEMKMFALKIIIGTAPNKDTVMVIMVVM